MASRPSQDALLVAHSDPPSDLWLELRRLGAVSVPTIVSGTLGARLIHASIVQAIVGTCGGKHQQAAAGLAIAVYVPFTVANQGVVATLGVLSSQAIGAGNAALAGDWLLSGMTMTATMGVACSLICIVLTPWLVMISTADTNVRDLASDFSPIFVWSAMLFHLFGAIRTWFLPQRRTMIFIWVSAIGVASTAALGHALACQPDAVGWTGAAFGIDGGGIIQLLLILGWAYWFAGEHHRYWAQARCRSAFAKDRVVELIRQGGFQALWRVLDEGACMVMTLLAGQLSVPEVATQSIYFLLWAVAFGMQTGLMTAISTRVNLHLGCGDAQNAKRTAMAGFVTFGILTAIIGVVLVGAPVAELFSNDTSVQALIHQHLLFLGLAIVAVSASSATTAPLMSSAEDARCIVAIVAMSAWVVGLPTAAFLAFGPPALRLRGLWLGTALGETAKALAAGWILARRDWADVVHNVQQRAAPSPTEPSESADVRPSTDDSLDGIKSS